MQAGQPLYVDISTLAEVLTGVIWFFFVSTYHVKGQPATLSSVLAAGGISFWWTTQSDDLDDIGI